MVTLGAASGSREGSVDGAGSGREPMKPVYILIISDAGAAGRGLLGRRDVELGWALTVDEATRSVERRRPRAVLTREEHAAEFMRSAPDLLARVPVVVLLEPDGWERRPEYFSLGATALVSLGSEARILEALTELTGLPTRFAPRVPYPEVVDVALQGSKLYLEAAELGTSGMAIRDFPPARVGERVEVGLVMMDPPRVLSGMVVRSHVGRTGPLTEIAFNALDDRERAFLQAFVDRHLSGSRDLPEPVGLTSDLGGGTFTLDLMSSLGESGEQLGPWVELLAERQREPDRGMRAPKWLLRVERELTDVERRVLRGDDAPAFARAALELRIDLARSQANLHDAPSLRESCELGLDFCRSLAADADRERPEWRAQVPEIRAGILTQIYGWTQSSGAVPSSEAA